MNYPEENHIMPEDNFAEFIDSSEFSGNLDAFIRQAEEQESLRQLALSIQEGVWEMEQLEKAVLLLWQDLDLLDIENPEEHWKLERFEMRLAHLQQDIMSFAHQIAAFVSELSEELPAEELPAEELPAEELPAEELPAEELPAEELPAEEPAIFLTPMQETIIILIPADREETDESITAYIQAFARKKKQEAFHMRCLRLPVENYRRMRRLFIKLFGVYPRGCSSRDGLYFAVIDPEKAKCFGVRAEEEEEKHRHMFPKSNRRKAA
jgi:hypothetical protein